MKNTKTVAATALAALALLLGACSSNNTTDATMTDYGQVRTENQTVTEETPAVIPGPAKVDSDGRLYTSSSVGSSGNASQIGTNTNVSIIPEQPKSTVTVTTSPVVEETVAVIEPPAPPVIIAEVAPPPPPVVVIEEEEVPMTSAVQEETRPRMSKD